ncbi:MAG: septum site-determining protein MinC [Myxococcales bacterium]|nr:septum site-determining protein MinC [Myxococcales bacterium]
MIRLSRQKVAHPERRMLAVYVRAIVGVVHRPLWEPQKALMSEMTAASETEVGSPICLKGTTQGFEILIESAASAEIIASEIEAKLHEAPGFFKGGDVILRFDDAPPRGYLGPIEEVTDRYELRIVGVQGPGKTAEQESLHELMSDMGLVEPVLATGSEAVEPDLATLALDAELKAAVEARAVAEERAVAAEERAASAVAPTLPTQQAESVSGDEALAPKMVVGPVRSGCILEVAGHLIILGDVNPGAEVRATGSIVVLGRLRGIAHAGSEGGSSFILALQLEPQQLRIGSLVARAGDADATPERAEIAYAKDDAIMVDNYKGRLPFGIATAKF